MSVFIKLGAMRVVCECWLGGVDKLSTARDGDFLACRNKKIRFKNATIQRNKQDNIVIISDSGEIKRSKLPGRQLKNNHEHLKSAVPQLHDGNRRSIAAARRRNMDKGGTTTTQIQ